MAKKNVNTNDIQPKLIDVKNLKSLKGITKEDLIADAKARKDKKAYEFVKEQSYKTITRKIRNSEEKEEIENPVSVYRLEYLTKFAGYVVKELTGEEKRAQRKAKRIKKRDELFAREDKFFE